MCFYLVFATDIIFFCDLLEIKIVMDFRFSPSVAAEILFTNLAGSVEFFAVFSKSCRQPFFSTADLLCTDGLLVCGIFGRIGYDQPLMEFLCSVRFIFIKSPCLSSSESCVISTGESSDSRTAEESLFSGL